MTTIGLAINPRQKPKATARYRPVPGRSVYRTYSHRVRNQKQALSTSLRSATQATDSTCSGCNANKNAANALRQRVPVARCRKMHNMTAARACSRTLCRWCQPLSRPKNWQSSM